MSTSNTKQHIPVSSNDIDVNKVLRENLPEHFNDVELGEQKGLLSFIGDPLGKALNKGLSPVGKVLGGGGDRMTAFTHQDPKQKNGEPYQQFGGKEQSGENPLGL